MFLLIAVPTLICLFFCSSALQDVSEAAVVFTLSHIIYLPTYNCSKRAGLFFFLAYAFKLGECSESLNSLPLYADSELNLIVV